MSQPKPAQPVRICLQNRSHSGVIKHFSAQAGVQFQLRGFFQALRWQPESAVSGCGAATSRTPPLPRARVRSAGTSAEGATP